jgi:hypothetical protein
MNGTGPMNHHDDLSGPTGSMPASTLGAPMPGDVLIPIAELDYVAGASRRERLSPAPRLRGRSPDVMRIAEGLPAS